MHAPLTDFLALSTQRKPGAMGSMCRAKFCPYLAQRTANSPPSAFALRASACRGHRHSLPGTALIVQDVGSDRPFPTLPYVQCFAIPFSDSIGFDSCPSLVLANPSSVVQWAFPTSVSRTRMSRRMKKGGEFAPPFILVPPSEGEGGLRLKTSKPPFQRTYQN